MLIRENTLLHWPRYPRVEREENIHGKTVVDKVLRRTSVSALQMADTSTNEGCERKWFFDKVMGFKEPDTAAQINGRDRHAEAEHYLITGEKRMADQVLRGLHLMPQPGSDLYPEYPMIPVMSDGSSGLAHAVLHVSGIPLVGYIDLVHDRGINKGCDEHVDPNDPPGTVEVIDWKFVKSLDFIKPGPALVKTIQMAGYGMYVLARSPHVRWLRLSHGYMPSRGAGVKTTGIWTPDVIVKSWEHAERVTRRLIDIAKETDPEKVPGNHRACRAFRKKCLHAVDGRCSIGTHNSLRSIVDAKISTQEKENTVSGPSLLQKLRPAQTQPSPADAEAQKAAETARLEAEEKELRLARAIDNCILEIASHGLGVPKLSGDLARLAQKARPNVPLDQFTGIGDLGAAGPDGATPTIDNIDELHQLVGELKKLVADQTQALAGTPPPTPASTQPAQPAPAAVLPPEAPIPATPTASEGASAPLTPSTSKVSADLSLQDGGADKKTAEGSGTGKKRGRPPKVKPEETKLTTPLMDEPVILFIDTVIDGLPTTSLHPIIEQWHAELRGDEIADIRCAPNDTPFGFGKWPGALAAYVREQGLELPTGYYTVESGGQLIEVVIEAMRAVCAQRGGAVVRGAK